MGLLQLFNCDPPCTAERDRGSPVVPMNGARMPLLLRHFSGRQPQAARRAIVYPLLWFRKYPLMEQL